MAEATRCEASRSSERDAPAKLFRHCWVVGALIRHSSFGFELFFAFRIRQSRTSPPA